MRQLILSYSQTTVHSAAFVRTSCFQKQKRNSTFRRECFANQRSSTSPSQGNVGAPSRTNEITLPRLAVFVSGEGSNFRAIHSDLLERNNLAEVAVVVSDNTTCGACMFAAQNSIPIIAYPTSEIRAEHNHLHNAESPEALRELLLDTYKIDFTLLAGYIKLVPSEVVEAFPRKMLNIHPGLLPAFGGRGFYGMRVHKAVIASGARFSGPTVHFVDNGYDTGPILAQHAVPVYPLEDYRQLAARVLKEEHLLYPKAVAALVENRISWRGDGIPILWEAL